MRKVAFGIVGALALGLCGARVAGAVEIESKAEKITMTGRVQAMWSHSSLDDGKPSNEFLIRRARLALKLKINDWVGGMIEPDFGEGSTALRDCYFKMEPTENFSITVGQMKRRFDLFELTSSTQILVIERDGRIGRNKRPSLSFLTEDLGFADRDIGVFVAWENKVVTIEGAVTNGAGANARPAMGEKQFGGRVSVKPFDDMDLELNGAVSVKPFQERLTSTDSVSYAPAFEGSVDWGNFKSGVHVQAGVVAGKNWRRYNATTDDSPSFWAFQGIATYKVPFQNPKWFEAVEPLFRLSFADPDGDVDKDGGLLLTPGVNLFVVNRTRLSANADIFLPQADDNPATPATDESDPALGLKLATWLYW